MSLKLGENMLIKQFNDRIRNYWHIKLALAGARQPPKEHSFGGWRESTPGSRAQEHANAPAYASLTEETTVQMSSGFGHWEEHSQSTTPPVQTAKMVDWDYSREKDWPGEYALF